MYFQKMKFRIVNHDISNASNDQHQKQSVKQTQTRQSSNNKSNKRNSFLQMVKDSYDYYMSVGIDRIKQQQRQLAIQKQVNARKTIKKQQMAEKRRDKRIKLTKSGNFTSSSSPLEEQKQQQKISNKPKPRTVKSTGTSNRRSMRNVINRNPINERQIFDVLDMGDSEKSSQHRQMQINQVDSTPLEHQVNQKQIQLQKSQLSNQDQSISNQPEPQLMFQDQGTYEIGCVHEQLLRVQKFIDEHINFKHQIREIKTIEQNSLINYLKSHGFSTFDLHQFHVLVKVNPYLYCFVQGGKIQNSKYLKTFKLNGYEIDKRLESTKRRMTQVDLPALLQ